MFLASFTPLQGFYSTRNTLDSLQNQALSGKCSGNRERFWKLEFAKHTDYKVSTVPSTSCIWKDNYRIIFLFELSLCLSWLWIRILSEWAVLNIQMSLPIFEKKNIPFYFTGTILFRCPNVLVTFCCNKIAFVLLTNKSLRLCWTQTNKHSEPWTNRLPRGLGCLFKMPLSSLALGSFPVW